MSSSPAQAVRADARLRITSSTEHFKERHSAEFQWCFKVWLKDGGPGKERRGGEEGREEEGSGGREEEGSGGHVLMNCRSTPCRHLNLLGFVERACAHESYRQLESADTELTGNVPPSEYQPVLPPVSLKVRQEHFTDRGRGKVDKGETRNDLICKASHAVSHTALAETRKKETIEYKQRNSLPNW